MDKNKKLGKRRLRRRSHVRNVLRGSSTRPRLCVQRSLKHFAAQLVDDSTGRTVCSVSTRDKDVRESVQTGGNCNAAAEIGKRIAEKASSAGITEAKLDRGHNRYHGRVKAFADAVREAGLTL